MKIPDNFICGINTRCAKPLRMSLKKLFTFTVSDNSNTLPGANIAVNGVAVAQTNANGMVTLPNYNPEAMIKISYVGYEDYIVKASAIVNAKVVLKSSPVALKEVVVTNNYKKPTAPGAIATSNTWMYLLVGLIGAAGLYAYSSKGSKVVKAKL